MASLAAGWRNTMMRTDNIQARLWALYRALARPEPRPWRIHGFSQYTGLGEHLGSGNVSNSFLAGMQFLYALALSPHPFLDDPERAKNVPELEKRQVLEGMRMLDLGCGHHPTFARCSRVFGAQVYTVDTFSEGLMYFSPEEFAPERREEEVRFHVRMRVDNGNVANLARRIGTFDYVSSAFGPDLRYLRAESLVSPQGLCVDLQRPLPESLSRAR